MRVEELVISSILCDLSAMIWRSGPQSPSDSQSYCTFSVHSRLAVRIRIARSEVALPISQRRLSDFCQVAAIVVPGDGFLFALAARFKGSVASLQDVFSKLLGYSIDVVEGRFGSEGQNHDVVRRGPVIS